MSKQVNTVAIGAFVVGAFLILFSLVFYLSGNIFNRNTDTGLMVFDGSVKGLKIGAPVAFKGVQIGEVVDFDVFIDYDTFEVLTPVKVRIYAGKIRSNTGEVDTGGRTTTKLIKRGLRAQLQLQSLLTGLLYIELDFHPRSDPRYTAEELTKYKIDEGIIIIPTIPTDMEKLASSLENIDFAQIFKNIDTTLKGIDKVINSPDTQALPRDLRNTLVSVQTLGDQLRKDLETVTPNLNALLVDADDTVEIVNAELPALLATTRESLESVQNTLANVDYLLSDDSAVIYDIREAAQELGRAGRSLQSLAETLETQPESLLKGKSPLGN